MRSLASKVRRLPRREAVAWAADKARAAALQVACPRCGAGPDHSCVSVVGSKRGYVKSWPHNARKSAVTR